MKKIAINTCFGGFDLSPQAAQLFLMYSGETFSVNETPRDNPHLIQVIEELGNCAASKISSLKVVKIPANVEWTIQDYDGMEHVAEKHRTWC